MSRLSRIARSIDVTIAVTVLTIIVLFLFVGYQVRKTKTEGVYTIAKVTGFKGAASGAFTYIDIYFQDRIYKTDIDELCSSCIGGFYFIKVNKSSIVEFPVFFREKKVPQCLLDSVKYYPGWEMIPDCK